MTVRELIAVLSGVADQDREVRVDLDEQRSGGSPREHGAVQTIDCVTSDGVLIVGASD